MNRPDAPAEVFPPGEYLRDELEARGWTEVEFAQILGRPAQTVSEIVNDRKDITPETALAIADAFGTSPELWLSLQSAYNLQQARFSHEKNSTVARRARLRELVPVRDLQKRGWLPATNDIEELEAAVCRFLGIRSTEEKPRLAVATRRSNEEVELTPSQIAWLSYVDRVASRTKQSIFKQERLRALAEALATRLRDPFDIVHVEQWLADCGVSLVIELPLPSSKMDGAAFIASNGMPVIALSTRGNRFDSFVFTLLHEIAHHVLGHIRTDTAHIDEEIQKEAQKELETNDLASGWIFPKGLTVESPITTSLVLQAAELNQVHPSLVIGRLQWDQKLGWNQFRAHIPKVRTLVGVTGA